MLESRENENIEIWGCKTYRPFRIYWILHEFNLSYKSYKIRSRTGETQTDEYLNMNPKGKIPMLKHNNFVITESLAAVKYITYNFKKPKDFLISQTVTEKTKEEEWIAFSLMELDCLVIYTLRRHEKKENMGLSHLYGEAPNAIKTSREHFDRMIKACEHGVPKAGWLLGKSPSVADIIFTSCLMHCDTYKLEIKSNNVLSYYERAIKRINYMNAYKDCFED